MLADTPIPTFPVKREGAHRCPELSPIQAIPHFKDFAPLVEIAESAEQAVRNRGKAEVGDKTMLDALAPAVQVIKEAKDTGKGMEEALDAAVEAAEAGMKSTIPLKSKHGRAAWQGEKTIGVQDAGATATYLIIESCVRHLRGRLA